MELELKMVKRRSWAGSLFLAGDDSEPNPTDVLGQAVCRPSIEIIGTGVVRIGAVCRQVELTARLQEAVALSQISAGISDVLQDLRR